MSEQLVEHIEEPAKVRYAGFWMRFWAYLADLLIVFSLNGILLLPFRFINEGEVIDIGLLTATGMLSAVIFYVYFLFMTKMFHQTLGKMIFGLKVVREDAAPLTWMDLFFREVVGRFFHRVFAITTLLYIIVAFSDQKQGIHDMVGNTRVVLVE
ncbi:RDD family protein [Aquibacillus salsiterrae]|uniref:RDD family protein n=1 Tax=Aquibacillus salsiterrae TaxID=2950439 RepID=A0A9X3WH04_9BACI|nr:RDD family protein [Aquibacillus salsiterrae]MDC3418458.1 RDD family protein [Aquibacillus salsiterrae]